MQKECLKNLTLVGYKSKARDSGKQQIIYLSSLCKWTEEQVPQIERMAVKEQVLLIIKSTGSCKEQWLLPSWKVMAQKIIFSHVSQETE